jgi:hypothetical protein
MQTECVVCNHTASAMTGLTRGDISKMRPMRINTANQWRHGDMRLTLMSPVSPSSLASLAANVANVASVAALNLTIAV